MHRCPYGCDIDLEVDTMYCLGKTILCKLCCHGVVSVNHICDM